MTTVARRRHDDSGEYSDGSNDHDRTASDNENDQQESDYDSAKSDSELSTKEQDSQETERRVDDDEDRSNPQYIPKRGTFYEHDDRTEAGGEEVEGSVKTSASDAASDKKDVVSDAPERRRPLRKSEVIDKWAHDKFNENEQMPKSRDELVAIYGYDIRNEDAPPHARRNRRYGRGPNKYTRTWEDEEAYRRQNLPAPRKPPSADEFPELDGRRQSKRRPQRPRSKSQPASVDSSENGISLRRNASIKIPKASQNRPSRSVKLNRSGGIAKAKERVSNDLPKIENLTITTNVSDNGPPPQRKVNSSAAQQRPIPTALGPGKKPPTQPQVPSQPAVPQPNQQKPQITQPQQPQIQQQPSQVNNVQPQATAESRGSKRYSSLRQRPLADQYTPQQPPQQPLQQPPQLPLQQPLPQPSQPLQQLPQQQMQQIRYNEYSGPQPPAQPPQQQIMHQANHRSNNVNPHVPSPPLQTVNQTQQQVRIGMLEAQQPMVPHHHQIQHPMQPHNMGQLQPSQGYAPPAMMPAQYMQGSNNAVYGGPMFAQPPPATYQLYQHHNYSGQSGVYYRETEQPRRRPTAAIPILRPAQDNSRPVNSAEKENIDRIVENMFVRKPWPATSNPEKSPSEPRSTQEAPSKESSQPNSLTSSSISTDSRPSAEREAKDDPKVTEPNITEAEVVQKETEVEVVEEKTEVKVDA